MAVRQAHLSGEVGSSVKESSMKVKQGLYLFSVTLSNGVTHSVEKRYKTKKSIDNFMKKFASLHCKQSGLEWTHTAWKWIAE